MKKREMKRELEDLRRGEELASLDRTELLATLRKVAGERDRYKAQLEDIREAANQSLIGPGPLTDVPPHTWTVDDLALKNPKPIIGVYYYDTRELDDASS